METLSNLPKVKMQLVGADGNAFAILGRFKKNAKKQGWDSASIDTVMKESMSGDYNNLLRVIASHTEDVGTYDEDGDDEDEHQYD